MQVIKQMFKDYCFKSALAKSFNAILFPLHFNTKRSGSIAGNGKRLAVSGGNLVQMFNKITKDEYSTKAQ